MLHHPPPPRRRRGRGGRGGGVRGLPLPKRDTTARKTRQKRALVTFDTPLRHRGRGAPGGGVRGLSPPPTYTPHPRHYTRAKMELPTSTIPPPPAPPYPGKNGTTHRHHTNPTPTNQPPAPLFLGGGRGQKSPSVPRCTTIPHNRAALPRAPTEGEPHGWARRGAERTRHAAWVGAERSGAHKARRMDGRGAERSAQGTPHGWARSGAERTRHAAWLRASVASAAHHGSAVIPTRAARLLRSLKGALRYSRRPSRSPHGSARSLAERCTYLRSCPGKKIAPT